LLVNHNFLRRRGSSVEQEMRSAFEADFVDFAMMFDGSEETYAFVKCHDYHSHVNRLKHSPAIKLVLSSFDSPSFLSDLEVRDFVASASPKVETGEFRTGDVVRVKNGFLSNLVGLVIKAVGKKRYSVAFNFHIRRFRQCISAKDLTLVDNVFRVVRSPVTTPAESHLVKRGSSCPRRLEKKNHERVQYRAAHRKCKGKAKR
jgi:hypothetical protein